jgi:hypothetical protein
MEIITGMSSPIYRNGGGIGRLERGLEWSGEWRDLGVVFSHQRRLLRWPVPRDRATLSQGVHELGKLTDTSWEFVCGLPRQAHGAALRIHRHD